MNAIALHYHHEQGRSEANLIVETGPLVPIKDITVLRTMLTRMHDKLRVKVEIELQREADIQYLLDLFPSATLEKREDVVCRDLETTLKWGSGSLMHGEDLPCSLTIIRGRIRDREDI